MVLIAILSGAILLTTYVTARDVRTTASRALIDGALHRTASEIQRFFAPVRNALLLARGWTEAGVMDRTDAAALNALFLPILREIGQISSLNLGDAAGRGFLLMRLSDRWRNRFVWADEWGPRLEFREWGEDEEAREWSIEEPSEEERYDPRSRAWYRVLDEAAGGLAGDAELPDGVFWTEPYSFFTTQEPGITAGIAARDRDGVPFAIAFDVLLTDLSDFTRELSVGERGFVLILDEDGRVLGLPGHPRFEDPETRLASLLRRPAELGVPEINDGVRRVRDLGADRPAIFSYESAGETYWANSTLVSLGANRTLRVVVGVSESELLGPIARQRQVVIGLTLLALLGGALIALVLSRRFSQPLSELAASSQRIADLDLSVHEPVHSGLREVEQLAQQQERMRVALDSFSRYVPVELVRQLLHRGEAARIGGTQRELTILFSDVVGFTTIAESMTPQDLTLHMSEYFEALLGIIQEDGFGEVNEIVGDGVVAFWGAPLDDPDHARHAVDAVVRCQKRLDELNREWPGRGKPPLPTCFGLASGPVVVGNVGAPARLTYAAVGDTTNVASRIEGLNRFYGTSALATAAARERAGAGYAWRLVDGVRVKGKNDSLEIYELLGRVEDLSESDRAFVSRYTSALADYRARRFEEARDSLADLRAERPGDGPTLRLLREAELLAAEPPAADWDGVTRFDVK